MPFICLNFLSLQFSSKCAFIFFNSNSAFISAKGRGGRGGEDFEIVYSKDESGIAKWSRAPLEANHYDGSYRSPGETWKLQPAALLAGGGRWGGGGGVEGLLQQLWS